MGLVVKHFAMIAAGRTKVLGLTGQTRHFAARVAVAGKLRWPDLRAELGFLAVTAPF